MNVRQALLWIASLVLLAFALGGCRNSSSSAPPSPEVSIVTVHTSSVPVTTELPGRTSPFLVAQVRARVDGIVLRRNFAEGADVTENQLLYQIDPAPFRAALASAQAQLERARANVAATSAQAERDKVLVAGNAVSEQAYINAVAAQRQAQADVSAGLAAVRTAAINLGYTDVIAPISGRIGTSIVTQGAYVQASAATLMSVIQKIDPIYVDLNQTSLEGLQLRRQVARGEVKLNGSNQAQVRLILEDGTFYSEPGKLEFSDITVDQGTGSVTVRAIFPNPRHVLLPGMFVRARIDQGTSRAILVPQEGVTHNRNGDATALVVSADNRVVMKKVKATRTYENDWVVEGGLNEGDRVIVSGLQLAQPGTLVRPKRSDTRSDQTAAAQ